jgi:bifunctional non-homologous end joining protein LigD
MAGTVESMAATGIKTSLPAGGKADPMPVHVPPMLALLSPLPADQEHFGFEYKWDGVRAISYWDGKRLRLESRNGLDITFRYPEFADLGKSIGKRAVLDGEIVALDEKGRPSFSRLQHRMGLIDERLLKKRAREIPAVYLLFDLLYFDRHSIMAMSYEQRRRVLEGIEISGPSWQTTPFHPGEGDSMLKAAKKQGLEGVVAKRLTSIYEPGLRSGAWRKIKLLRRQEFVIAGWVPEKDSFGKRVGALLLGYYERPGAGAGHPRLIYAGRVGTGFDETDRLVLRKALERLHRRTSPFSGPVADSGAVYVKPELVAEIEYREWTPHGTLRHPSYKGLRFDKAASEVTREDGR